MTSTAGVRPATTDGAGVEGAHDRPAGAGLSEPAIWWFVACGALVSLGALALPNDDARSFVFDSC